VLKKAIKRRSLNDPVRCKAALDAAIHHYESVEPTDREIALAAELEYQAQRLQLQIHSGECLLCAVLVTRNLHHLLTGDKAAIAAVAHLDSEELDRSQLTGKLICLEQAILALVIRTDCESVRKAICAEPAVDMALRICFSCGSEALKESHVTDALGSYIGAVQMSGGDLIANVN
jgi:hypothetical protein